MDPITASQVAGTVAAFVELSYNLISDIIGGYTKLGEVLYLLIVNRADQAH
jgi:hypothetical protein